MAREKAGFLLVKTLNGGPPAIQNYPLVQTAYYEGNVLRLSGTTGSAALAAAAGTSILGVIATEVTNANAASGDYPVYLADANNVFEAKMLVSSTPQAKVGDLADLAVATKNFRLQGTASTNVISIHGYHPDEAASAHTGVRYWVTFARSIFAQTKSDSST